MDLKDNNYDVDIIRGYTPINDYIIDYLKPRIRGHYLDIGCNSGFLLSEHPNGIGVDLSTKMVDKCKTKGLNAVWANAENLPFEDESFHTVVLSCVLEQCPNWEKVLSEAIRVCDGWVIGTNPVPGSRWGTCGGNVKSVIYPEDIHHFIESKHLANTLFVDPMKHERYYFEIQLIR